MTPRLVVLGAGFGGLELTAILSESLGETIDIVLIDRSDAFVFGYSKLDVMFGRLPAAAARHPYRERMKPGVRFVQTTVRAIDPVAKRVVTEAGMFEADYLVVALGADLDPAATPGLVEYGHEFYTVPGAFALRDALAAFPGGSAIVGVTGRTFKCPPAPSEAALLLHDYLRERDLRTGSDITLVMPFGTPVPPSPETSQALLAAFAERGIRFIGDRKVASLDGPRRLAVLDDGRELPCDLLLGVPVHRVPPAVVESGLSSGPYDWVAVDKRTLATRHPGVYAVGDVNGVGTPKAGVFAEGAARVVAQAIVAELLGGGPAPDAYTGRGACYVEFGDHRVGRVDVDFLSGPRPTGTFQPPSAELVAEKGRFGTSRLAKWFAT